MWRTARVAARTSPSRVAAALFAAPLPWPLAQTRGNKAASSARINGVAWALYALFCRALFNLSFHKYLCK